MVPRLVKSRRASSPFHLRESFYSLWLDPISGRGLRTSLFLFLLLAIVVGVSFWRLPPEIPFTYSRPWGVSQLVPSFFLFVLVTGAAITIIINTLLASFFSEAERVLARIVVWTGALTVSLVDIAVIRVVLLVI